jgi:hypothetical protein
MFFYPGQRKLDKNEFNELKNIGPNGSWKDSEGRLCPADGKRSAECRWLHRYVGLGLEL